MRAHVRGSIGSRVNPSRRLGVVNPIKFDDLADVKEQIAKVCADHGWGELVLSRRPRRTSASDRPEALSAASTSCVLSAATGLSAPWRPRPWALTPHGPAPGGTGNLRPQPRPPRRSSRTPWWSFSPARTGGSTWDWCDCSSTRSRPSAQGRRPQRRHLRRDDEEVFLVMTGIGVDAEVMPRPTKVKGVLGWPAYVFAGRPDVHPGFMVRVLGRRRPQIQHARSVIVATAAACRATSSRCRREARRRHPRRRRPKGAFGWGAVAADPPAGTGEAPADRPAHVHGDPCDHRQDAIETQIDGDPKGGSTVDHRVLPKAYCPRRPRPRPCPREPVASPVPAAGHAVAVAVPVTALALPLGNRSASSSPSTRTPSPRPPTSPARTLAPTRLSCGGRSAPSRAGLPRRDRRRRLDLVAARSHRGRALSRRRCPMKAGRSGDSSR